MQKTILFSICFFQLFSIHLIAQVSQGLSQPNDDNLSVFSELGGGLLLDNTRTKGGRDFYEMVYKKWAAAQLDTLEQNLSKAIDNLGQELTIEIEEQPSLGTSTIVSVSINSNLIWRQFLQPREAIIDMLSDNAILYMSDYVINYNEYVQQLSNEDQKGDGIY